MSKDMCVTLDPPSVHRHGPWIAPFWIAPFCALVLFTTVAVQGQNAAATATTSSAALPPTDRRIEDIERRLNQVTAQLNQTQQALQQSLLEVQRLSGELKALHPSANPDAIALTPQQADTASANGGETAADATSNSSGSSSTSSSNLAAIREQQDAQQAEIEQHDQTKVETVSKYPLRVTGLVLFNAFSNAGVVDNAELPTIALPRTPGSSHGSLGAVIRQTVLGLDARGPTLFGARSSAQVTVDFFGQTSYTALGYSTSTGLLRLREAKVSLDWDSTTLQAGVTQPIFTPLSPTSYATVAAPALSAAGNLWSWSPQLSLERRFPLAGGHQLVFAGGLIDPGSSYTTIQLVYPTEAARRPGYEGRVAFRRDRDPGRNSFAFGVGIYSANQSYNSATMIHSWAVTGDWQMPLFGKLELSGEAFRGRSLGDFGSGSYKNLLTGVDPVTRLSRSIGIDGAGGWSQLKFRLAPTLEANVSFGLDDSFASNFETLILSPSTAPFELNARNHSITGNLIFRPKTYLILSPEYRHIESWRYTGSPNVANVFSLSAGYQF